MKRVLLVLAIVFLSACVQKGEVVDPDNGLKIKGFSVDPEKARIGDNVQFILDVENQGGTTARCVTAELLGVSSWSNRDTGSELISGLPTYNYAGYASRSSFDISYSGSNVDFRIAGTDSPTQSLFVFDLGIGLIDNVYDRFVQGVCDKAKGISNLQSTLQVIEDNLLPPDRETERSGDFRTLTWLLNPPILAEGVSLPYDITARVSYVYKSTAGVNIKIMSKKELDRRLKLNQDTSFPVDVKNTVGAPIKIDVERIPSPIVINTDQVSPYDQIPFTIKLKNVGDGWPLPISSAKEDGLIFGRVFIDGHGVTVRDCGDAKPQQTSLGQVIILEHTGLSKLRSDKTATISCVLLVDRNIWKAKDLDTLTMQFDLIYGYYIDKDTKVTVFGVPSTT